MQYESLPHHHGNENEADYLKNQLDKGGNFQTVAEIFKQLSDSSRIRIFWLLCHIEECVINISALVGMTSPAVCHHLRQLKAGGLILSRREGKEVYYKAADTEQSRLLHLAIEKIMEISCPESSASKHEEQNMAPSLFRKEQVDAIRQIHDYLMKNLDKRITTSELAREYLMNTTTLKEVFKGVYGVSIAAHMRQHRMEKAASLLLETRYSVDEIARKVGYESQSKFTAAFKSFFKVTPLEYRKQN